MDSKEREYWRQQRSLKGCRRYDGDESLHDKPTGRRGEYDWRKEGHGRP